MVRPRRTKPSSALHFSSLSPLLLAVGLLLSANAAVHAQSDAPLGVEEIQWLGWPENMTSIFGAAINDSGRVVVSGNTGAGIQQGYLLTADGWTPRYVTENRMVDLNDVGMVAGWVSGRPLNPDSDVHAFFWSEQFGGDTSEFAEPAAAVDVRAVGIDEDGNLYGSARLDQGGTNVVYPFRWKDGFEVLTGTVAGGEAMASNDLGQIAVRRYTDDGYVLSIVGPDDSVNQLPIPLHAWTYPKDINDLGHVVGDAENAGLTVDEGFLWDGEAYTILPRPAGFTQADAEALNDLGQIVGWGWDGSFGALAWENGQAYDLSVLAEAAAGGMASLRKAYDVSDSGWVVGYGYPPGSGAPQIFRARLGRACPDPATGEGVVTWTGTGDVTDGQNWSQGENPATTDVVVFEDLPDASVLFPSDVMHESATLKSSATVLDFQLAGHTWSLGRGGDCLPALQTVQDVQTVGLWDLVGGTVSARGSVVLGHGGQSRLTLSGGTSLLVEEGPVLIGHADTTRVDVVSSTLNATLPVLLGARRGERAALFLESSLLSAVELSIGAADRGRLETLDSDLQGDRIVVGDTADGDGILLVDGAELLSSVVSADEMLVGNHGVGDVEVQGATVATASLRLGSGSLADGRLRLFGTTRLSTVFVQVGIGGTGALEIHDGAGLQQGSPTDVSILDLGVDAGSAGTLVVSGEGSTASLRNVAVGVAGTGVLEVSHGAEVGIVDWLGIADQPGSVGEVHVHDLAVVRADSMSVAPSSGATASVVAENDGFVIARYAEIGPGATLRGGFLALETVELEPAPGLRRAAPAGGSGLRVQSLSLAPGATVEADSVVFGAGWSLGGGGAFPFDLTNNARVDPGGGDAPGRLEVAGGYTQTADGVLAIDVFGPEDLPVGPRARMAELSSDEVVCTGPAHLAGTLELSLADGLELNVGDTFHILSAPSVTGGFDHVLGPGGMEVEAVVTAGGLELVVTATPVSVSFIDLRLQDAVLVWTSNWSDESGDFLIEGREARGPWRQLARIPAAPSPDGRHRLALADLPGDSDAFRVHARDSEGRPLTTSAVIRRDATPAARVSLSAVRPNPFNPRASFSLRLAETLPLRVRVLDARGRVLDTLHDGPLAGGREHSFRLEGASWASGVYLLRVEGPNLRRVTKFTVLK